MLKVYLSALCFIFLTYFVFAQEPLCPSCPVFNIETNGEYEETELVRVVLRGAESAQDVIWIVVPDKKIQKATTDKNRLEFIAPPGDYQIIVVISYYDKENHLRLTSLTTTITIKARAPPEPPKRPDDPPSPPPSPPKNPWQKKNTWEAIGRLQTGSSGCTATHILISENQKVSLFLTAAHCVSRVGEKGTYTSRDNRFKITVTVAILDRTADIAWLIADRPFYDLPYAHLAFQIPRVGTPVWHGGYGIDKPGNKEEGVFLGGPDSNNQLRYRLSASPGDSGGAIVDAENDVVLSPVCCGDAPGKIGNVYGGSPLRAFELFKQIETQVMKLTKGVYHEQANRAFHRNLQPQAHCWCP